MALTKVIGSGVGDLSTFTIDGSANDLMTFRTTGDSASQVLGLQFQNNSEAVTAQIFGTGDNSSSGVFRIKGIGSIELHGGDVAVSGDATNMLKIDANGHVTMPNQTAFLVIPSTAQNNIPINGNTTVTFATEVFDQNADFASNTFTAPVTGRYLLNTVIYCTSLDLDSRYYQLNLTTSNRTYYDVISPPPHDSDIEFHCFSCTVLADMDANDTATVVFNLPSDGAAQMDIQSDSHFSGYLVA